MMFKKAVKHDARLRLAICGPSGSGKSYTSLKLGTELANGGKIAAVDTERGSMSKYADLFEFDVCEFQSYDPLKLIESIKSAEAEGYTVFIIDSLSHFWFGKDGELDKVDQVAKRSQSGNSFAAWKEVTPIHNRLVDALLNSAMHIICTMRTKTEWVLEEVIKDGKKKSVPRKIGMAPIMRDGIEFEFDVCGDMDQDNNFLVSKSRCPKLVETGGGVYPKPGKDMADILKEWLAGVPVSAERKAMLDRMKDRDSSHEVFAELRFAFEEKLGEQLAGHAFTTLLNKHGVNSISEFKSLKPAKECAAEMRDELHNLANAQTARSLEMEITQEDVDATMARKGAA
jgi:hypothetical protein